MYVMEELGPVEDYEKVVMPVEPGPVTRGLENLFQEITWVVCDGRLRDSGDACRTHYRWSVLRAGSTITVWSFQTAGGEEFAMMDCVVVSVDSPTQILYLFLHQHMLYSKHNFGGH